MARNRQTWQAKLNWAVTWTGDSFALGMDITSPAEEGRGVLVELDRAKALALRDALNEWAEQ